MQHLEPVDMLNHIRLGLNSLVGGLDSTNKHMPYWSIGFAEGELGAFRHSGAWDWCHDVARSYSRYRHGGGHHRGMCG